MHIGLPLLVLLLMWVHVQRVPKARTTPPRPIVASLLATLLVLSLARPALSQGGAADLGTAVLQPAARLVLPRRCFRCSYAGRWARSGR